MFSFVRSFKSKLALSLLAIAVSTSFPTHAQYASEVDFSDYPHFTNAMKKRFTPFIIIDEHPLKANLDELFGNYRVTESKAIFLRAGFKVLDERPRSFVIVARHPKLKDHLIKCYLDTELREKQGRPSWKWLADRCIGAEKVANVIKKYDMKHFAVAKKYIYPLPVIKDSFELSEKYSRHPILLLVTDMKLVNEQENLRAWKTMPTKEMLDELYLIIKEASGSSYRADNIAYSRVYKKFCFIDCEYPYKEPDFRRIAHYLNSEMKSYWYSLVKNN